MNKHFLHDTTALLGRSLLHILRSPDTIITPVLTWLAVVAGLAAKSPDGAGAFAYPLLFLPFVSSAFVPTAGMPGPVQWFAEHQPVTTSRSWCCVSEHSTAGAPTTARRCTR